MALLALAGGRLLGPAVCLAGRPVATESQVKVAFIYNFLKFTDWPTTLRPAAPGDFVLGVIGDDPVARELVSLEDLALRGRPIVVRRYKRLEELSGCEALYIGRSERERLPSILAGLAGAAVLTMGDDEGFAERGGMLGLRVREGRVRFQVNLAVADHARLRISLSALRLGEVVSTREETSP